MGTTRLALTAALAAATALTGAAVAQEKSEAKPVALRMQAKKGDVLHFQRTRTRTVVCPELGTDSSEEQIEPYTVTVLEANEDGSLELELAWGKVTGKIKAADGSMEDIDSETGVPMGEDVMGVISRRAIIGMGGAKVKVTVDARGSVTATEGLKEVFGKLLADTPLAGMEEQMPEDEARDGMQEYLPALPTADQAPGATWTSEHKVDFGARRKFGYVHTWQVAAPAEDKIAVAAELKHVPGDGVPEGQSNAGEGAIADTRSAKDGFVLTFTRTATFKGEGNFNVDGKYDEKIERITK